MQYKVVSTLLLRRGELLGQTTWQQLRFTQFQIWHFTRTCAWPLNHVLRIVVLQCTSSGGDFNPEAVNQSEKEMITKKLKRPLIIQLTHIRARECPSRPVVHSQRATRQVLWCVQGRKTRERVCLHAPNTFGSKFDKLLLAFLRLVFAHVYCRPD